MDNKVKNVNKCNKSKKCKDIAPLARKGAKKPKKFLKNAIIVNVEKSVHNLCKIDNLCRVSPNRKTTLSRSKVN